jgi:CHAD domain-containing protein
MLEWRPEVLKHEEIEAVHKMRVASRRLRATLDAYEVIGSSKPFKRIYRQIKEIADILGKARDTDVMIEDLSARLKKVSPSEEAGLLWLIDRLQTYRQQHQLVLEKFLSDLDDKQLSQSLSAFLSEGDARHGKG